MKQRWLQLKFIWEYATHLQTDNNPPLDLIFKFINELDKKEVKTIYHRFSKTETSQKVFDSEVCVLDKIKTGKFEPGTFGAEFQTWMRNNDMVDLFKFGYEGKGSNSDFTEIVDPEEVIKSPAADIDPMYEGSLHQKQTDMTLLSPTPTNSELHRES